MTAVNYRCQYCDQENWTEDSRAGEMRECKHCGKFGLVPSGGKKQTTSASLKICPNCAEKDLQPEAKVCKHCGKKVDSGSGCLMYSTIFCLVIGALLFPPLILPGIAMGILWLILRQQ